MHIHRNHLFSKARRDTRSGFHYLEIASTIILVHPFVYKHMHLHIVVDYNSNKWCLMLLFPGTWYVTLTLMFYALFPHKFLYILQKNIAGKNVTFIKCMLPILCRLYMFTVDLIQSEY